MWGHPVQSRTIQCQTALITQFISYICGVNKAGESYPVDNLIKLIFTSRI